jgi:hypothetical protein
LAWSYRESLAFRRLYPVRKKISESPAANIEQLGGVEGTLRGSKQVREFGEPELSEVCCL